MSRDDTYLKGPIEYAVDREGELEYICGCKFIKGEDKYENCWFWEHCSVHGGLVSLKLT